MCSKPGYLNCIVLCNYSETCEMLEFPLHKKYSKLFTIIVQGVILHSCNIIHVLQDMETGNHCG